MLLSPPKTIPLVVQSGACARLEIANQGSAAVSMLLLAVAIASVAEQEPRRQICPVGPDGRQDGGSLDQRLETRRSDLELIRVGRATAGVDGVDFAMLREGGPTLHCMVERAAIVALAGMPVTTGGMVAAFDRCRDRVEAIVADKLERGELEAGMVVVEFKDVRGR